MREGRVDMGGGEVHVGETGAEMEDTPIGLKGLTQGDMSDSQGASRGRTADVHTCVHIKGKRPHAHTLTYFKYMRA